MAGRGEAVQPGARATGPRAGATVARGGHRFDQNLIGWGFVLPFVAIFTIFMLGPIVASLLLSFTDFGLADLRNPLGTDFVGLDNFATLLGDSKFTTALFNTAYFVLVGVPATLILGLAAALA